jgi:hypothetical protein
VPHGKYPIEYSLKSSMSYTLCTVFETGRAGPALIG